ncbi:MAG: HNH endonuclease, partial [Streptosporangiaceae bacterium]
ATAWLARHLPTSQPADGSDPDGPQADDPAASQPGDTGPASPKVDLDELLGPLPEDAFTPDRPRALRRAAARAGQPGWLTGKAALAYSCDAKIAPMVCGHLDRHLLARAVTDLLAGDLANLITSTDPIPTPGPRCTCDEHPAPPRAAIPGSQPSTGPPCVPAAAGPVPPGLTAPPGSATGGSALTPGGLARLQDTLLRYAVSLLSGPAGLASYLRTQLTGGFFPAPSLPLDLGQPTEQVPPHLRRAVTKRDRHCSFPGCTAPPVRCHVHHLIPRSQGGPTRLDNLTLLCAFHHLIAVHRWGWTLQLHADGTTTAISPDGRKVLHSHSPPPGQDPLWADPPAHGPPATAA